VWDPYTRNQINQLEPVQRRAARFVNNNFYNREPGAVTAMLSELSWETLEQRRAKTRAVDLMYKIINNLVDIPSHTLLIPADGRTRGTTVYRVIYTRIDAILLLSAYHTHLESHTSRA
jgi:hypothetical protein